MAKIEVKVSRKKIKAELKTLAKRLKAGTVITRTIPAAKCLGMPPKGYGIRVVNGKIVEWIPSMGTFKAW